MCALMEQCAGRVGSAKGSISRALFPGLLTPISVRMGRMTKAIVTRFSVSASCQGVSSVHRVYFACTFLRHVSKKTTKTKTKENKKRKTDTVINKGRKKAQAKAKHKNKSMANVINKAHHKQQTRQNKNTHKHTRPHNNANTDNTRQNKTEPRNTTFANQRW